MLLRHTAGRILRRELRQVLRRRDVVVARRGAGGLPASRLTILIPGRGNRKTRQYAIAMKEPPVFGPKGYLGGTVCRIDRDRACKRQRHDLPDGPLDGATLSRLCRAILRAEGARPTSLAPRRTPTKSWRGKMLAYPVTTKVPSQ